MIAAAMLAEIADITGIRKNNNFFFIYPPLQGTWGKQIWANADGESTSVGILFYKFGFVS